MKGWHINSLLKKAGALAVSGYCTDVDSMESAAFELLVMTAFQHRTLTVPGAKAMHDYIIESAGGFAKRLDFRMRVR